MIKKLIHLMCWPVHGLVRLLPINCPHKQKIGHCIIGAGVAALGVWMAHLGHHYGVMALDYLGYWVHGFGGVPIAKVVLEYLEVES